ncbi:hypothetical protein CBOVI_05670 [Corynebacterium bovis DSM 20582 = CIP 54.80]|nr:hypothetical protein CBOVI_05670 [Corynebacterium bovis DSM 20582 = CIP 54.80]
MGTHCRDGPGRGHTGRCPAVGARSGRAAHTSCGRAVVAGSGRVVRTRSGQAVSTPVASSTMTMIPTGMRHAANQEKEWCATNFSSHAMDA